MDFVGDCRDDVPMLDELAVLHTENVDADVTVRADEAGPVRMDGDDVAIGDDATDIALGVGGKLFRKKLM